MNQQLKGIKCFNIVPKKLGFYDFFEKYCVFEKNFVVDYFLRSARAARFWVAYLLEPTRGLGSVKKKL